jgi:hypothetical protein
MPDATFNPLPIAPYTANTGDIYEFQGGTYIIKDGALYNTTDLVGANGFEVLADDAVAVDAPITGQSVTITSVDGTSANYTIATDGNPYSETLVNEAYDIPIEQPLTGPANGDLVSLVEGGEQFTYVDGTTYSEGLYSNDQLIDGTFTPKDVDAVDPTSFEVDRILSIGDGANAVDYQVYEGALYLDSNILNGVPVEVDVVPSTFETSEILTIPIEAGGTEQFRMLNGELYRSNHVTADGQINQWQAGSDYSPTSSIAEGTEFTSNEIDYTYTQSGVFETSQVNPDTNLPYPEYAQPIDITTLDGQSFTYDNETYSIIGDGIYDPTMHTSGIINKVEPAANLPTAQGEEFSLVRDPLGTPEEVDLMVGSDGDYYESSQLETSTTAPETETDPDVVEAVEAADDALEAAEIMAIVGVAAILVFILLLMQTSQNKGQSDSKASNLEGEREAEAEKDPQAER